MRPGTEYLKSSLDNFNVLPGLKDSNKDMVSNVILFYKEHASLRGGQACFGGM